MAAVANDYRAGPVQHHWSPYASNGGTILGIAGPDFAVLASDTRLSEGFEIMSRDTPKAFKLSNKTVLGCCGFHGDVITLTKVLAMRLQNYEHAHDKTMSTTAIAQMLSNTLYYKRFFPYYTYNILAGVDEEGRGAVYSYDPVGSHERETYRAGGSAAALLQPLLDNQLGYKNQVNVAKEPLSVDRAVRLARDVFVAAAERDIYTGDGVEIQVVTKDGVQVHRFPLRRD
eukprot:Opistho-2@61661